MSVQDHSKEAAVLQTIIAELATIDEEARERVFSATACFLGLGGVSSSRRLVNDIESEIERPADMEFSDAAELSPKEFLIQKAPQMDIERVACLAYYLTHYRELKHFKTLDISKVNTDAAQPKFSNTAWAVKNAAAKGFLVPGKGGMKQLGAFGEEFVRALPDREQAKIVAKRMSPRRKARAKQKKAKSKPAE